jgi:hypothetical protein
MSPLYEHENFGDVQRYVFMKGIITSVDSENDLADVTIPGGSDGSGVPIFYHCSDEAEERSNGAIEGGSAAFSVDSEVIVMYDVEDNEAVRIIGFVDGIKKCGKPYLVISTVLYEEGSQDIWSSFYIIWDVSKGESVHSITWEDTDVMFPYLATFSLKNGPSGEVIPYHDPNEVPDEDGLLKHQKDPFYKWLMDRVWPPENEDNPALCPDPDHFGLPVWPVTDALSFTEVGRYGYYEPVLTPDTGAICLPGCVCITKTSGGCSDTVSDSVAARFELGEELGMVNTGTGTAAGTCTLNHSEAVGPSFEYSASGSETHYTSSTINYASVPESRTGYTLANHNLVESSGPFLTAVAARISEPDAIVDGLFQPLSVNRVQESDRSWGVDGVWTMGSGYGPGTVDTKGGTSTASSSTSFGLTFETPLGELTPISVGGAGSVSHATVVPNNVGYGLCGIGVRFDDRTATDSFVEPGWVSDLIRAEKNKYHCKVALHGDVMYQIYYYSAYIVSYTTGATPPDDGIDTRVLVESSEMTSHIAGVESFPGRDAVDRETLEILEDPLGMGPDGGFHSALKGLFSAAKAANAHNLVWSLDVRLFH